MSGSKIQASGKQTLSNIGTATTFHMPGNWGAGHTGAFLDAYFDNGTGVVSAVSMGGTAATKSVGSGSVSQNNIEVWEAKNVTGGVDTVVVTPGGSGQFHSCAAVEFAGLLSSGATDSGSVPAVGSGTSTAPSVTSNALAQADSTVFAVMTQTAGTNVAITAPGGWTEEFNEPDGVNLEPGDGVWKNVASTTAVTATWTLASSSPWIAVIVAFKAAPAAALASFDDSLTLLPKHAPPPPPRLRLVTDLPLSALPAPALSASVGFLDQPLRWGREQPAALRAQVSGAGFAQPTAPTTTYVDWSGRLARGALVAPKLQPLEPWRLSPLAASLTAFLNLAPGVVRAGPPPVVEHVPDAGQALAPLQPFPSPLYVPETTRPSTSRLTSLARPTDAGQALFPLASPSLAPYLPESPLQRASGPAQSPRPVNEPVASSFLFSQYVERSTPPVVQPSKVNPPARPDGSSLIPLQPFPSALYVPQAAPPARGSAAATRPPTNDLPLPPLAVAALLPWFDPAPPPLHRESSTKRPVSADPATLTALPFVISAWADFAPLPPPRATQNKIVFAADLSIFPVPAVSALSSWGDFAPAPKRSLSTTARSLMMPDDSALAALPPSSLLPAAYNLAPSPTRRSVITAAGVRLDLPLPPLAAPPLSFAELSPLPARARAQALPGLPRNEAVPAALPVLVGLYFELAPQPARGKPPADPPLPPPWFLPPLVVQAPSAWADFAQAPRRGFVSPVHPPAAPAWDLRGVAAAVVVPLVGSGEVVFNPTFPSPILVPFIPSGEAVPPPSFVSGTFPGLIASTAQVFEPSLLRRPDQINSMLDGGTASLLHVGASGRLFLTPLDQLDARTLALRTLRRYIALLNFRREVAPGEDGGRAFRLSLSQIHTEQPKDSGGEADLPSIAFLPGVGSTDTLGIGGISVLEDTLGVDGDGTAIAKYGEYSEQFTIEVVSATVAHRNGLVAGLKQALRMQLEWNETLLVVPELFGAAAEFSLDEVEYVEEPYADQNRRRALLRVTLTVPELFIIRGFPLLDPRVLLELGVEVVIEPRVDADVL